MGCLTAKVSGTVASFINPTVTDIESARVYFSPTQLGSGTPSPENVREIVGRTSVELYQCGKNLSDGEVLGARFVNNTVGQPLQTESTGTWKISKNRMRVDGGSKLYCYTKYGKLVDATNRPYIIQTDENDNFITGITAYLPPLTLNSNTKYIRFQITTSLWNDYGPYFFTTTPPETIPFLWKRLPDEYQEVEWIESTGTQAILTDIPCQLPLKTDIDVLFTQSNDSYFCGTRYGDVRICSGGNYQNNVQWAFGTYKLKSGIALNTRYLLSTFLDNGNQSIAIDGDVVGTYEYTLSESEVTSMNGNLALFAMWINNSQTFGQYAKAKCYGVKISNNNALLGNFIPCYRKSDNEIGMYDTVSQTFYTNQGTGTFTKGNDVFSDEVYGGYVDLVTGEVWADHAMFTVDESNATCTLKTPNRLLFIFPLKYYFSAPSRKGASMCTILPENASTNWNYGYVDNISATETTNHQLYLNYTGDGDGWSELVGEEATVENVKAYLRNAGFAICATLRTPILMRTLTPQQLQTFKNENNIWSNGDSVEIDYDLAETFDIQKAKRKIIMNQPHVETLTGDAVSFTTDMKAPLKECKVSFMPVQEGSGDPSPTNVRNITGWTGVSVKNGENTYSVDWTDDAGTVYGGYVDLAKGELVEDWQSVTYNGSESENWVATSIQRYYINLPNCNYIRTDNKNIFCNKLTSVSASSLGSNTNLVCYTNGTNSIGIRIGTEIDTKDKLLEWLSENPITIVQKLTTPITHQLTPQQILSLKGINNFSCGIKNDMTVKYWKHKLSDSTNIAYEAENLTFDGTNYIDTGIYLFSEENINRDFEVVIEDLYGSTTSNNTIVCAKYNSTAIGFLIRLFGTRDTTYNGTIFMKKNNHNNITIRRINGAITIDGEIITNPTVQFTNAVHPHPLMLGCALQDNGTPFRYATGTIGHITVKWL